LTLIKSQEFKKVYFKVTPSERQKRSIKLLLDDKNGSGLILTVLERVYEGFERKS